ncbi:MAG: hypothetical protein H2184_12915 [Candidatus Galacturonibacter soehngenii]|nr:hypothetical protein [Candidatus Galacturonibacter soehngenii]
MEKRFQNIRVIYEKGSGFLFLFIRSEVTYFILHNKINMDKENYGKNSL